MPRRKGLRPRVLSSVFGILFLIMAVIAYWFATGPGSAYQYGADLTRVTLAAYLVAGAALLVGVGVMAVGQMRSLDRRIEEAENAGGVETIVEEVVAMEETPDPAAESEGLPPPLEEAPAPDHVDQDIDELLVSLEEIETVTEESAQEAPPPREPAPEPAPSRRVFAETVRRTSAQLETLKRRRESVPAYFAGPALASAGIVAITAAMLPGSDAMLQSAGYYQLDTALLLGIGYSFGLVALFTALAIYGILRSK